MSILDGPGEGTWSVFAQKVVEERDSLKAQLECAQAFHDVAVKERDLARVQLTPAMRERDELFEQVASLKTQLGAAQRAYDRALEQRDEAKAEVAKMKARPAEAEYARLDLQWQKLVKERDEAIAQRDKAKEQLKRTRANYAVIRESAAQIAARHGNLTTAESIRDMPLLGKARCACQLEAGDSPCPVHGEESE